MSNICSEAYAMDIGSALPVAGVARALHEGKSATAVKAEKIVEKSESSSAAIQISKEATELAAKDYSFDAKISTIKETAATSEPSLITVGAASADVNETISENIVLDESVNHVDADSAEPISGNELTMTDYDEDSASDLELVDAITSGKKSEEDAEDFSNLVIAQVNDYVNVRQEPSEESEIVGKLYNNSVGDLLEEADDWYRIKSGNCEGYVKGEYVITGDEAQEKAKEVGTRMAVVTTTTLYVRKEPSTEAEVIGMVPIEDELLVTDEQEGWAGVSIEEGDGYVSTEFVKLYTEFVHAESKEEEEARLAKEEAERKAAQEAARKAKEKNAAKKNNNSSSGSKGSSGGATYSVPGNGNGSSVANFALQFVGNPYVYGGSSLTNGTDCSGFVMSVYRNFGVSLPHSSGGDRGVGYDVGGIANAQAGDIVCYSGHVGIYIGGGKIVHASTPSSGIKVSDANYRSILAVRRIF